MSSTKTEFKWFDVTKYEDEQDYLREQHKQGWKLVRVGFPGFYHFEECQPEDVVYQLDYNKDGIAHKAEYRQMFEDCGWEYMFDFVGYSYFRKAANQMAENEEIFCDEESRLDMMNRVFKGKIIPLLIIFFLVLIPQIIYQTAYWGFLSPFPIVFAILLVLYVSFFIQYGMHYWKFKNKLK